MKTKKSSDSLEKIIEKQPPKKIEKKENKIVPLVEKEILLHEKENQKKPENKIEKKPEIEKKAEPVQTFIKKEEPRRTLPGIEKKIKKQEKRITPEQFFYLNDGSILTSKTELYFALSRMSDATFNHHVNLGKNDFASWILNVLEDKETSEKIKFAKSKDEMRRLIR